MTVNPNILGRTKLSCSDFICHSIHIIKFETTASLGFRADSFLYIPSASLFTINQNYLLHSRHENKRFGSMLLYNSFFVYETTNKLSSVFWPDLHYNRNVRTFLIAVTLARIRTRVTMTR